MRSYIIYIEKKWFRKPVIVIDDGVNIVRFTQSGTFAIYQLSEWPNPIILPDSPGTIDKKDPDL